MAEKVLRLGDRTNFFAGGGIHLIRPEKTAILLPEHFKATKQVEHAIKTGALVDVNKNVTGDKSFATQVVDKLKGAAPLTIEPAPVTVDVIADEVPVETPVDVVEPTEDVDITEEPEVKEAKPKAKSKK